MTIIYFILLLSIIIVIHEAGHLFAAKKLGVYCYEFSFGMGPAIWQKKKGETVYSVRAVPIGGFVSMAGEQDGDVAYPDVTVPEGRRLTDKKPWQKIIIMLAGVFMNFMLAWVIFSLISLASGQYYYSPEAVIGTVVEGSAAERAGFQAGDRILRIEKADGTYVEPETFQDMQVFNSTNSEPETYTVLRDGEEITLVVTPEYDEADDAYYIGIVSGEGRSVKVNLLNCWYYGGKEFFYIAGMMFTTIASLFRGKNLDQLSGPVGIYEVTDTYAKLGFSYFMLLVGQLSLNVGIFNLLPLPVLDGGQVVITLGEWIAGRKLDTRVKTGLMMACWVILLGLMLFVTWNDIAKLFS